MDEVWERAVEVALEGEADPGTAPRTLTLDGAVKCLHGRLPPPGLLERFQSLEDLSIASVGVSSLEKFPRLRNLQRLILSDNRIAGGLEFLVEAGLDSLRDLDLSNNRIQFLEDLAPLARLHLVSLDLYECPVTRVRDYRSKVFGMIRSLKYLDKMDAEENERPETDEEEDDDEDDEEEEEEDDDDPGSGEVDGEDRVGKVINGGLRTSEREGVVAVDEDEESDADEVEAEAGGRSEANGSIPGSQHVSNGFPVATSSSGHGGAEDSEELEEEYTEDYEDEEDLGEEIDEEDGGDEAVREVREIDDSEEEDGVEENDEDEEDGEDDEDEEENVEDDDGAEELGSAGRLRRTEGEIDGHEQGEEDEYGGIGGDDEEGVDDERESDDEDGEDEEDETEYLVQPIGQKAENGVGSDLDAGNEDGGEEEEVDDEEDDSHGGVTLRPSPSRLNKRRRDEEDDEDDLNDDSVEDSRSLKHHRR